jgi:class 3 adenylate cyclase/tetratricopeptide (TPR) repeat protein
MLTEQQQLEAGIQALEAQRALLGDAVVDASLAGLRAKLAALAALPEPAQTLKQVSILFLDVVGSTTLAQHLDPEAIGAVMDDALVRGTAIVEAHRGKVLQYAGDNILAAFGAEASAEDDAERAVHCGLALLELGRVLGAEVQAAHGHAGFNIRVGVHTGGVLLGGGVDADGAIRGIAVNIAARMEQTAPAGHLRISHNTYAQVRGLFEVEAQEPLLVKGVDQPVQSYLVIRAKPRSFHIGTRGIEGVATRMIGRDAELEALQATYSRLFQDRKMAAVTVVAEAGIGKSRLLYEFEAWSEMRPERFFLFRGRATPQTGHQAYGLMRDILAWRFQIVDDDNIESARKKMEAGIVPLFEHDDGADLAEAHAHLLGHLIGIDWGDSRHLRGILDDAKQIRNRAFHTAAQIFRRISTSEGLPVVLQLEDLHWADSESLDFLNYLGEVNRDVPLLVLAFTRPTLFEWRKDWSCTEGIHQRIDLHPLDKVFSRMLANELLKKLPDIPAALRELLTSSAEGNPFYMEELVKMLIDQGAIQTRSERGEGWKVDAERLLVTQVPPTLTGVLQARLDSLPAAERLTLQQASVIGQVFWDQALIALDGNARLTLPMLVRRELTLPRSDAEATLQVDGLREYAFRHAFLHQVTYATVLKPMRRELHATLAQWLSQRTGLRANDFLALTAQHFEEAGDSANAVEYHARAAEHAEARLANEAVLSHVQRALEILETQTPKVPADRSEKGASNSVASPVQSSLRWRLLKVREVTLDLQGKRDEQRLDLNALDQLADALDDDRLRAYAAFRRSFMGLRIADWELMESAARRGAELAGRAGDQVLRLKCRRGLADALASKGDWRAGQALAWQTLEQARELGLVGVQAVCLNLLGQIAAMYMGDPVAALELDQQYLAASRETGNRLNEAIALGNVGDIWRGLGDLSQARRDLEAALQMTRTNGDRSMECLQLCNLSALAIWHGDANRALSLAHSARELAVAVEAREFEVAALVSQGDAELAQERHDEAARAFAQAQAAAVAMGHPFQHDATAGLARAALAQGGTDAIRAALLRVEALHTHLDGGGNLEGVLDPRLIELTCHQVLAAAHQPRAAAWLARAHAALQVTAESITDEALRRGFLSNIPHHRKIVAAWAASDEADR